MRFAWTSNLEAFYQTLFRTTFFEHGVVYKFGSTVESHGCRKDNINNHCNEKIHQCN